ncbi:MAG: hypothetical protein TQ37_07635 [Candidatus Synechococcus spongiarum 15L]|uniref:Uncharacterized protein n=1 Tax=Candidatus Synechococcus spongiarum 15L TaxID=1608419 RepID=A0A0G8ATV8_9SYNE|nr:MAG: hypothetical protein TQ37_07635 [Candidatus Synechococcus spongiarum 15L]
MPVPFAFKDSFYGKPLAKFLPGFSQKLEPLVILMPKNCFIAGMKLSFLIRIRVTVGNEAGKPKESEERRFFQR